MFALKLPGIQKDWWAAWMIQRRKVYLFYCPLGFVSQVNIYSHTHKSGSGCKIKKIPWQDV